MLKTTLTLFALVFALLLFAPAPAAACYTYHGNVYDSIATAYPSAPMGVLALIKPGTQSNPEVIVQSITPDENGDYEVTPVQGTGYPLSFGDELWQLRPVWKLRWSMSTPIGQWYYNHGTGHEGINQVSITSDCTGTGLTEFPINFVFEPA
jgi:hypothetical protein